MKERLLLLMKTHKVLIITLSLLTILLLVLIGCGGNADLESEIYERTRGQMYYHSYGCKIVEITSKSGKEKDIWEVKITYDIEGSGVYGPRYRERVEEWSFRDKTARFIRQISDDTQPASLWYRIIHKIW